MSRLKLLTAQEVSDLLQVPIATLRTMRSRPGKDPIPFVKVGRLVRYREEKVLEWLQRNTFDDTGQAKDHREVG